ncbi:MAG TPA: hypothetical protein VKA95_15075 [Nitrososphaeraceae archaeon]|nr:hypothetical protein [Nitrososphaeraceae archaeon]
MLADGFRIHGIIFEPIVGRNCKSHARRGTTRISMLFMGIN